MKCILNNGDNFYELQQPDTGYLWWCLYCHDIKWPIFEGEFEIIDQHMLECTLRTYEQLDNELI